MEANDFKLRCDTAKKAAKKIEEFFEIKFGCKLVDTGYNSCVSYLSSLLVAKEEDVEAGIFEWEFYANHLRLLVAELSGSNQELLDAHFGKVGAESLDLMLHELCELFKGLDNEAYPVFHELRYYKFTRNAVPLDESEEVIREYEIKIKVAEFERSLREQMSKKQQQRA